MEEWHLRLLTRIFEQATIIIDDDDTGIVSESRVLETMRMAISASL